jgi:hypothetical protein
MCDKRLRWFEHLERNGKESWISKCRQLRVEGAGKMGRPPNLEASGLHWLRTMIIERLLVSRPICAKGAALAWRQAQTFQYLNNSACPGCLLLCCASEVDVMWNHYLATRYWEFIVVTVAVIVGVLHWQC